ncbi:MAG: DAK2 domain-containing protein, partial [Beggiatoa sp.]|nr:DAK2 domain-containing protein [Beggiatoa sp.]
MEGTAVKREDTEVDADLKTVVAAAHVALMAHAEKRDTLDVYPVPDGDTGTNMLLTLRSVLEEVPSAARTSSATADAVARAALLGARGNSGVI